MPHSKPPTTVDWADGTAYTFAQIYHTPVSVMYFRASGLANGDYTDLSNWFQCVYSVHATRNTRVGDGAADTMSIQISGTYPNNCGPVIIYHDPDTTSGCVYDIKVIGHKAEGAAGLS